MIRLGVLGAGGRGHISKRAHRPERGFELAAMCDTRPVVYEDFKKNVNPDITLYSDYRRLLDEARVEAVFITTPDYLHEEMAVAALERGIHVYVEKPLAITIEGCDRVLQAAKKGAKLYIGHNMRFFPVIRKMKEIIESGRIGQVQAIWCRHFIAYRRRRILQGLALRAEIHDRLAASKGRARH